MTVKDGIRPMQEHPEHSKVRRVLVAVGILSLPAWVFLPVLALQHFDLMPSKKPSPAVAMPRANVEVSRVAGVSRCTRSAQPPPGATKQGVRRGPAGLGLGV